MSLRSSSEYPFRGIFYLLIRSSLWGDLFCGILLIIVFTIVTSVLLFVFAFPSQSESLSHYMGKWIAWLIGFVLTIFEIGIVTLIFSCLFLAYYMETIFDRIWKEETISIQENENENRSRLFIKYSCIKSFFSFNSLPCLSCSHHKSIEFNSHSWNHSLYLHQWILLCLVIALSIF